jgi:hypothetical protein
MGELWLHMRDVIQLIKISLVGLEILRAVSMKMYFAIYWYKFNDV